MAIFVILGLLILKVIKDVNMHFLGLKWDNSGSAPAIQLALSPEDEAVELYEIGIGDAIDIAFLSEERYCIGYYDQSKHQRVSCGSIADQGSYCGTCWKRSSGAFLPLGVLNDSQKEELREKDHFNYINLFGSEIIKVGVVSKARKYTRIWEQGAHASLFFSEGNGLVVREIEEWISHNIDDVKERVMASTKAKHMYKYPKATEAHELLMNTFAQISERLPVQYRQYLGEQEFLYSIDKYHIAEKAHIVYYIKNFSDINSISGKVLAISGEIIILEDSQGRQLLLNTKLLLGRLLDVSDKQSEKFLLDSNLTKITFPVSNQASLF